MFKLKYAVAGLTALIAFQAPATAQDKTGLSTAKTPKIFDDVLQCRAITDSQARLACFDKTVGTLAQAQQNKDLYVADKQAVQEARRGLFGFDLPKVKLFGDNDMAEDVKSIETTIKAVSQGPKGYIFTLEDGARWAQKDGAYMDKPKAGSKIRIRRAALGSYMGSIEGRVGFRIERLNN
ncbi:hypothetical protein G7076_10495 [Sphingomonas sp. HDW15A]|uniref:hypothetical protein n=1 Tax=Sphingomonas sp. HDW15A TaxID=2714942 RepID=UPI00140997A0|nr:hypothetical protein [Sphingomonas sp. HDW15A]QIK96803.1 hypothetical protein G7076_10495 [Sphingomonas sp. HDW15A]